MVTGVPAEYAGAVDAERAQLWLLVERAQSLAKQGDQPALRALAGSDPARVRDPEEDDMQFLISLHINPAVLDALTDEEKAAIGDGHGKFIEALRRLEA